MEYALARRLADWLTRPSGIGDFRDQGTTATDASDVYPATDAAFCRLQANIFYRLVINELDEYPDHEPINRESPEIIQNSLTALREVKAIYKKLVFYQHYPGGSPLQLCQGNPYQAIHYPLPGQHLCTKALWFPIVISLVKTSSIQFRNDKRREAKMASEPTTKPKQEAEQVGLKVCLMSTQSLFENRQSLPERTFEKVMDTTKKILGRSQRDAGVR